MSHRVQIDCICPPKAGAVRHPDGDTVVLSDALGFRDAVAIRKEWGLAVRDHQMSEGEALAILHEGYVLGGVEAWTLVGEDGKPLPVSKGTIQRHLLTHYEESIVVADAADDLYSEAVVGPLVRAASTISQSTSGDEPTPPTKAGSTSQTTEPSKPSLTSITPMASTEGTSGGRAGGSRPSRRSRSAA